MVGINTCARSIQKKYFTRMHSQGTKFFVTATDTQYSHEQHFIDITYDFLAGLLLDGGIRLSEIPAPLRCAGRVYIAALRVSRNFFNHFIEDTTLLMADYENLEEDFKGNYNSQNELRRDILGVLDKNVRYGTTFKGARAYEEFMEMVYEPFLQRVRQGGFDTTRI